VVFETALLTLRTHKMKGFQNKN